jgi:hypothetical protein
MFPRSSLRETTTTVRSPNSGRPDGLSSPSPPVREAAAYGSGILGWGILAEPLEAAMVEEREPRVVAALRSSIELMKAADTMLTGLGISWVRTRSSRWA